MKWTRFTECEFGNLKAINSERVQVWVSGQLDEGKRANKTINLHVAALKAFCNWCVKSKRMMANPLQLFPMLDNGRQKYPRRALTPDELERLLKVARLRPVAEFGRAVEKIEGNKRANWRRKPLSFSTMEEAYKRGQDALAASPNKLSMLDAAGQERALVYSVLVTTGLRLGELASITVADFKGNALLLSPDSEKNGQGSTIPVRPCQTQLEISQFRRVVGVSATG